MAPNLQNKDGENDHNEISSYEILKKQVQSNEVNLSFVLSLPRTNSTAIHIALTQAPEIDGQLNEPFINFDKKPMDPHRKLDKADRTFDGGCKLILDRLEKIPTTPSTPKKLVIHEQLCDFVNKELPLLFSIADNLLVVLRHPIQQGFSFLTRYINNCFFIPDTNHLDSQQSADLIVKINTAENIDQSFLNNLDQLFFKNVSSCTLKRNENGELCLVDFSQKYKIYTKIFEAAMVNSWNSLEAGLPLLLETGKQKNVVIIDSTTLLENPSHILQNITHKLKGITFSSAMISNWTKGTNDNFYTAHIVDKALSNAWIGPAATSTGLKKPNIFEAKINYFPSKVIPLMQELSLAYEKKITPLLTS